MEFLGVSLSKTTMTVLAILLYVIFLVIGACIRTTNPVEEDHL